MFLLKQTNLIKFNLVNLKNLRACMPIRNGGLKTITRAVIEKYAKGRIEAGCKSKSSGQKLIRSVQAFETAIYEDPVLRMCFQGALDSIPKGGILYKQPPSEVFHSINNIAISAPQFHDQSITGVPFYALLFDFLDTRFGQGFFSNPIVNYHLKQIYDDYQTMLCSKVSLQYMNESQPSGWFCKQALTYVNYDDYYVERNKPNWGFTSWNDWFTRAIRPEARPIDPRPNAIVQSSDSYPLVYPVGSESKNPATNVQGEDNFWLKDNKYSLYDMFGAKKMNVKKLIDDHFVGGTVYQAFLDPWCYHRWHSPVSGTVVKSYKLGGTYYLDNPSFTLGNGNPNIQNYIDSQPLLSTVSVRQCFIIKLDDGSNRHVGVIEIGMAEVSGCMPTVIEGQKVSKGEQLGYFQFGGSSHVVVFDKAFDLTFNPAINLVDSTGHSKKQLVNSWLATFK